MDAPLRVLFLCTGNSARSQMAEALLRQISNGRIEVLSAGSDPRPEIHPLAREAVRHLLGLEMEGQYPKPLQPLLSQRFDYVISVCDRADAECPAFPGDTERIHWSFEDPAAVEGNEEEKRRAFEATAKDLRGRIRIWLSLPRVSARTGGASVGHAAVGCYITAACWFTSSTSFANPAVTLARSVTNTFAGIRPADVPGFLGAQLGGALAASWCAERIGLRPT